jgi:hypothetical protein
VQNRFIGFIIPRPDAVGLLLTPVYFSSSPLAPLLRCSDADGPGQREGRARSYCHPHIGSHRRDAYDRRLLGPLPSMEHVMAQEEVKSLLRH